MMFTYGGLPARLRRGVCAKTQDIHVRRAGFAENVGRRRKIRRCPDGKRKIWGGLAWGEAL